MLVGSERFVNICSNRLEPVEPEKAETKGSEKGNTLKKIVTKTHLVSLEVLNEQSLLLPLLSVKGKLID